MTALMIYYYYHMRRDPDDWFREQVFPWVWAILLFMFGISVRLMLNVIFEQKLTVDPKLTSFNGVPHVTVLNKNYGELLDLKVTFELIEFQRKRSGVFIGRLHFSEHIPISSIPAAQSRRRFARLNVRIPVRILDEFRGSDDAVQLVVRAISVHPITNFRGITEAVVFCREMIQDEKDSRSV